MTSIKILTEINNNVNPLYIITDKINWCIEESNINKYLTINIVPTDASKDTTNN